MSRKKLSLLEFVRKHPRMSAAEVAEKRGAKMGSVRTTIARVRREKGVAAKRGRPAKAVKAVKAVKATRLTRGAAHDLLARMKIRSALLQLEAAQETLKSLL